MKIGVIFKRNKKSEKLAKAVKKLLRKQEILEDEKVMKKSDAIVVIGGDGTVLKTEEKFPSIPKLTINTGEVGFLAEIEAKNAEKGIKRFLEGKYEIEEIKKLECECGKKKFYALNDFYFLNKNQGKTVKLMVRSKKFRHVFWGDGLIISSQIGSSAYSLSAGGPILMPGVDALVLTPIVPILVSSPPIVFGGKSEIKVDPLLRKTMLFADGEFKITLNNEAKIKFSNKTAKFIKVFKKHFWDKVNHKIEQSLKLPKKAIKR